MSRQKCGQSCLIHRRTENHHCHVAWTPIIAWHNDNSRSIGNLTKPDAKPCILNEHNVRLLGNVPWTEELSDAIHSGRYRRQRRCIAHRLEIPIAQFRAFRPGRFIVKQNTRSFLSADTMNTAVLKWRPAGDASFRQPPSRVASFWINVRKRLVSLRNWQYRLKYSSQRSASWSLVPRRAFGARRSRKWL